ncbi:MAG: Gldg family protein [Longimicrobiales bacterium]
MKRTRIVAEREIQNFFDHPTAYILMLAFLGLSLFLALRSIYALSLASLRPLFDLLPWLFAVFIPALTMRSVAEEKRTGTIEWLSSYPLGELEILMGKLIGNWFFVILSLAGTLPMAIGVFLLSDADPGIMLAQYIGASLLAMQGVAIGLWASTATKNQVTAFILATSVSFALVFIGTPVVLYGLTPFLGTALSRLSVMGHFENVARGVIDLRDIVYFLSTAGLFVAMAVGLLVKQRLSEQRESYKRLRAGIAILLGLVVVTNLLGGNIRGRVDLTRESLYTLSPGSEETLDNLSDLVTLKLFISDELPSELEPTLRDVRDLISDMSRAGGDNLVVENLNPGDDLDVAVEARSFGIIENEFNVLRDDEFEVRRGWFGLALLYADQQEVIPFISGTADLEFRIASAISVMTTDKRPSVAFLTGLGALGESELPSLGRALMERYEVTSLDLSQEGDLGLNPENMDLVVLAGPKEPVSEQKVNEIENFISQGGGALILVDKHQISLETPTTNLVTTGLEEFLQKQGIGVDEGLVMDYGSNSNISMGPQGLFNVVRPYPLWPIGLKGSLHATTRDLNGLSAGWATAITIADSVKNIERLWITTEAGGIQPPNSLIMPDALLQPDPDGFQTVTLAVAIGGGEAESATNDVQEGRIIVVGDVDFLEESFIQVSPDNLIFAENAIDWLAQDEALIAIRSKTRTPPPIIFTSDFQKASLRWGNLIGVPLLIVIYGVMKVTGRRRRAEVRWGDYIA